MEKTGTDHGHFLGRLGVFCKETSKRRILRLCWICGFHLLLRMIGESVIVIGSSLYVFCSLFEWKQSVGYILFHAVREYSNQMNFSFFRCRCQYLNLLLIIISVFTVACIPSVKWAVGITKWFHLR